MCMKYLHIHALSVSIYTHSLLRIYLGYRKLIRNYTKHNYLCGVVFFILKGLFDTQKEGSRVLNYNEKGFFDNFKLCNVEYF